MRLLVDGIHPLLRLDDLPGKRQEFLEDGSGARLLSSYELGEGRKLWVITEADRTSTCLLLPEEY